MTRFDKFRSLSLSLFSPLLSSTVDIRSRARRTNSTMRLLRVYHPIRNRRVSGCACCACNGHRGKINCCPRAFNHGLDLFISTSTYLPPPPLRRKVHGVYPRYFFHYFLPLPPRPRTPNLMKNHSSTPGKPPSIFRKGTIVSARSYRIKSDASSITPINYLDSPSSRDLFLPPARASGWYSNFFDRF